MAYTKPYNTLNAYYSCHIGCGGTLPWRIRFDIYTNAKTFSELEEFTVTSFQFSVNETLNQ